MVKKLKNWEFEYYYHVEIGLTDLQKSVPMPRGSDSPVICIGT